MTRDEALMRLYEHVRGGQPVGYTDMTDEQRKAYMAEANRASRARQREAAAKGDPLPSKANIRTALADAALMILATDGPGAENVRRVLQAAFPSKPGVLLRVEQQAKSGTIRPKLVDPSTIAKTIAKSATHARPATHPQTDDPAPDTEAQREPVGAMTPEEIEAIVPAFLRRGT